MTSDEFDRMVVQGAVQLMLENDRKCLERGGMILAKEVEGELWIKASDHYDEVNRSVDAEREACAAICDAYGMPDGTSETARLLAHQIRARRQICAE